MSFKTGKHLDRKVVSLGCHIMRNFMTYTRYVVLLEWWNRRRYNGLCI